MIPEKVYEMGAILGLEESDIKDLVPDASASDIQDTPLSPANVYKDGSYYGTISIKDFK